MSTAINRHENQNQVSRLYDDPFATMENRMGHLFRSMFDSMGMEAGLGNYPVDGSDVEAELNEGVLTLTLKKTEESKPRRVEIKNVK